MVTNENRLSANFVFLLYLYKLQIYTFCNYTEKFKMIKTYLSETI